MHSRVDILIVASHLFYQYGYHGTTMREIARALGLREASLYTHIKSKEEILWEIIRRVSNLFLARARAVPQHCSPEEQMRLLVRGHFAVIAHEEHATTVFFHEWAYLSATLRAAARVKREAYEGYFRRVIEQGAQQGVFQIADTRLASLCVLSALNWSYQWLGQVDCSDVEHLADSYTILLLRLLKGGEMFG